MIFSTGRRGLWRHAGRMLIEREGHVLWLFTCLMRFSLWQTWTGQVCHVPGKAYFTTPNLRVVDCRKKARRRFVYFFWKKDHTPGQTLMKDGPAPSPASESEMKNSQRNLQMKECEWEASRLGCYYRKSPHIQEVSPYKAVCSFPNMDMFSWCWLSTVGSTIRQSEKKKKKKQTAVKVMSLITAPGHKQELSDIWRKQPDKGKCSKTHDVFIGLAPFVFSSIDVVKYVLSNVLADKLKACWGPLLSTLYIYYMDGTHTKSHIFRKHIDVMKEEAGETVKLINAE